jgi:hypothetical protein
MLGYVYDHPEIIVPFVASLIPDCHGRGLPKASAAIGVVDEAGHLIAGLVYHGYQPEAGTIEISGAALPGRYWMTRETLRQMYGYPFLQLGCQMVINRVPAEDTRQLYMMARFGYDLIPFPRMLGRDRDGVIGRLTVEDWLGNKFNKRLAEAVQLSLPLEEAA